MGRCRQEGWEDMDGSGRCSSGSHPRAEDAAGTMRARTPTLHAECQDPLPACCQEWGGGSLPTSLAHASTGNSPDVGLVLVVLAGEVARRALVGDAHHGDLLAIARQVAWRGAAAALLAVLHRRVWGHTPIGMAAPPQPPPRGHPAGPQSPTCRHTYLACGQHTRCTHWGSRWTRCLRRSSWSEAVGVWPASAPHPRLNPLKAVGQGWPLGAEGMRMGGPQLQVGWGRGGPWVQGRQGRDGPGV